MKDKRIRILHMIASLNRGGAEMVIVNLCNHMNLKNFEVKICSLSDQIPLARQVKHPNQVVVKTCGRTHKPHSVTLLDQVRMAKKLRVIINEHKPHIVHSHLFGYNAPLQCLSTIGKICTNVVTVHNTKRYIGEKVLSRKVFHFLENVNFRLSRTHVIAVSNSVADSLRRNMCVSSKHLSVIYNGIDTDYFSRGKTKPKSRIDLGLRKEDLVAINVGNLYVKKGQIFLIRAWQKVLFTVPNARLILVGDGPIRRELETEAEDLDVSNSIRFLGHRDNVRELLATSDLAVFPSLHEGFGLAAVEMMAMELPVVASDIGPLVEVVNPPVGGVVIPIGKPDKLADAIILLFKDKTKRIGIGLRARSFVEKRFSIKEQTIRHEDLYKKLVS